MTRAEILDCLTDRPCDVCKFNESGRCERWDCVFEEKPDDAKDCEDKRMTREEAIKALRYERKTALHENKSAFDMAIQALSAEPCEDAISRISVLDTIDTTDEFMDEERTVENYKALLKECYEVLPSITPKQKMGHWIPTSERLPEDGQNVLFCDIDEDIMLGYHVKGRPDTHFSQDGSWDDMKNVFAWMPLPEPYKAESEDTE